MAAPRPEAALRRAEDLRPALLAMAPVDPPAPETAAGWLSGLERDRFAACVLADKRAAGPGARPLVQPRGGFARYADQRALTLALAKAGADFLPLTIDSHTRHNDHETARILLERSELEDANLLNGYPLVNHGYRTTRALYDGVGRPVSLRHGTPDARLLAEVALASGITEIEGGGLTYTLPYNRAYPLRRALLHWQYVDRLCALHSTVDRPVHRESFGVLTATMVPPAMVAAVEICELLLAAEQGVTSFSVSFGQTGSVRQDLALARVLRDLGVDMLARFGFGDVAVSLVYHQWMGAFPVEAHLADSLIATSAQIAALVGADKVVTKTRAEARGIPTVTENAEAVRLVRYVLDGAAALDGEAQETGPEAARIRRQAEAILEAIFDMPGDAFWDSVARAYEEGILDIPFAPHEGNRNRLVTRRGVGNGIYIVDPGDVPLPADTLAEEQAAVAATDADRPETTTFRALMRDLEIMLPPRSAAPQHDKAEPVSA